MRKARQQAPDDEPVHGFCAVCGGRIERGMRWTFTGQLNRVHHNPDECIRVLHPKHTAAFMKLNPMYQWPRYE